MYRAVCPNCGKSVTLDEPAVIFCPYCKAEIPLLQEAEDLDEDLVKRAAELVDMGNYELLITTLVGKDGRLSMLYRAFAQLMMINRDYIQEADKLYDKDKDKAAFNALKKLATGSDAYAENPIHTRYMKRIEEEAGKFADLLEKGSEKEGKVLAGIITKKLLLPSADNAKSHIAVVLMADDYSCHKLVPLLTDEDLLEIYETYTQAPDFHLVSPKQVLLAKEMKKEILDRGLLLPGGNKGLLDRIKQFFK